MQTQRYVLLSKTEFLDLLILKLKKYSSNSKCLKTGINLFPSEDNLISPSALLYDEFYLFRDFQLV